MPRTIRAIPEIRDAILETGGSDVYKCYQCGKCVGVCPWYQVEAVEFPVYRFPQAVKLGITTSSEDKSEIAAEVTEIFRCVGCDSCTTQCPRGVDMPDIMRAIRRILVEYETVPSELKSAISKTFNAGNPLGEPRERRAAWSDDLGIPTFNGQTEFLYFSCCIPAYNARAQELARSTSKILQKAGVSFGVLGERESCCSESIRKIGSEKVFEEIARANIAAFNYTGVQKVLVTSPHCYSTFKRDYPEFGAKFQVVHETELFADLIKEKKLRPRKQLNKRVVYHDPCLLGRKNDIYDEPREILKSIPGLELVEIENFNREYSLCCGGGSGGFWLDRPVDERITNVRVKQAFDTGADVLAVACPYCLQMFEDAVKVMNLELEVKGVSELLWGAL